MADRTALIPMDGLLVPLRLADRPPPGPPETFPENDVEVVPDCFPDGLLADLDAIADGLEAVTATFNPSSEVSGPGIAVNSSRRSVVETFRSDAFVQFREALVGADGRQGAVGWSIRREFESALDALAVLERTRRPTSLPLAAAMTRTPTEYTIDLGPGPPMQRTLPGYGGPTISTAQTSGLLLFVALLSGGAERDFRLPMLRAECLVGRHDHTAAIAVYEDLLGVASLTVERRKLVAIRTALAHVAAADRRFRAQRNPAGRERRSILAGYTAAIAVLDAHAVSGRNPRRRLIERHIEAQRLSIDAGFNAIGYKDGYVPVLRADFLRSKAIDRVDLAVTARDKFVTFRLQADQLDDEAARTRMEADVAAVSAQIAAERRDVAGQQTDLAGKRREHIEEAQSKLDLDAAISGTTKVISAVASAYSGNVDGIIESGKGLASLAIDYRSRGDELDNQMELARIEEEIAERGERIAELEEEITALQVDGLGDRLDRLGNRLLDADLFYALSSLYEDMAERSLVAAVEWAFLYERAVAFRRLLPDLELVDLDYRQRVDGVGTAIPAPEKLLEVLTEIGERDVPTDPSQLLDENPISLRANYPIEFSRFLQTGEMDFVISLYDLEKLRPGVFHRRLGEVRVQVRGSIPSTGFTGHIIHRGFFTLRDRDTTLGPPPAARLLPTAEQTRAALADLSTGNIQGDSVGGVLMYLLNDDDEGQGQRQELSAVDLPGDDNPEAAALALFEGYGETGQWHLEIANIDRRFITDVLIGFRIRFPEPSGELEGLVEDLITGYETDTETAEELDKIAAFSLRDHFPDAFDALGSGPGTFELVDADFPNGITDLRVKAVVGQFLDDEGDGVEGVTVRFTAVGAAFDETRTSLAEGFTEAMDEDVPLVQPPSARVPAPGTWQVRLADTADAARIDDLRIFLVYSFRPAGSS